MNKQNFDLHIAQRDIYVDELIHPLSAHYNIGGYIKLIGKLNINVFLKAVNSAPEVFDAFKMRFNLIDPGLKGRVDTGFKKLVCKKVDFSERDDPEKQAEIWMQDNFNKAFHLQKSKLPFEHYLLKISENEHWFYGKYHHLITDGYGFIVFVNHIAAAYKSTVSDYSPLFNDSSYLKEIASSGIYLNSAAYENDKAYWFDKFKQKPADFLHHSGSKPNGNWKESGTEIYKLNKKEQKALIQIQKQSNTGIQPLTLAALLIYFGKTSEKQSFVFGVPVHKRGARRLRNLFGVLSGVIPFQGFYDQEIQLNTLINEIISTQKRDYRHQHFPISELNRELKINPLDGYLYEVSVNYEPLNFHLDFGPDMKASIIRLANDFDRNPLQICWRDYADNQSLELHIHYRFDYFKPEEIRLLKKRLLFILEQFAGGLNKKLEEFKIIPPSELELLREIGNSTANYPKTKTLIDLFEQEAEMNPDKIALLFENSQRTYREINQNANQIAHFLREQGIGMGNLVPICLDRSFEMIEALLGVLKAGAAFVPIDPDYPQNRIHFMLEDSEAKLVLTSKLRHSVFLNSSLQVVELNFEHKQLSKQPKHNLKDIQNANNLAYVIYTSGSTGLPKGVMIEHRSVVNLLLSAAAKTSFTRRSVFLSLTSFSFDICYLEFFLPLVKGGKLVLVSRETALDGYLLSKAIATFKPTHLQATPANWQIALESGWKNTEQVKMIIGGEAVKEGLKNELTQRGTVYNFYGPTETTIWSTSCILNPNEPVWIGKPLSNTRIHILGSELQQMPIGSIGEIYIGGDGLARGYYKNPTLTSKMFIADPWNDEHGARIYRTGDLGRWLPDGNIEFLGRVDEQIKVRGFRIEPGEIESLLDKFDGVKQSVVLAKEDAVGNKNLVAFVAVSSNFQQEKAQEFLKSELPAHMIPTFWVKLNSIPLTPNGKIDKRALTVPDEDFLTTKQVVAPGNITEQVLSEIWCENLGLKQVGVHDNFFELGGHSLIAMRLITSIRKVFDIELSIKDVFKYATIQDLANRIILTQPKSKLPEIKRINTKSRRIPLSFNQERLWFIDQIQGSVNYHSPLIIRIKGELNTAALERALRAIIGRHESLRTAIIEKDGGFFQQINQAENWKLEHLDEKTYHIQPSKFVQEIINKPFNLAKDFMLRAGLIGLSHEHHVLIVTLHHIASDGWSVPIIVKELSAFYNYFDTGVTLDMSPLPIQYADYANWQRKYLKGAVLEHKLNYWKQKLLDVSPLQIPADFKRPLQQSIRGDLYHFEIGKDLSQKLAVFSKEQKVTLFMTFLSAFKVLLFRYSNQEDICVGVPVASRQHEEIQNLAGFFANTLVLRSTVNAEKPFNVFLEEVKQTTLEGYIHQDAPFEKVVETLVERRDLSRSPLFQVAFVFENKLLAHEIKLGNTSLQLEYPNQKTAKFEITLILSQTPEGIEGAFEYCSDLFKLETMKGMAKHFIQLLKSIAANCSEANGKLIMVDQSEENKLIHEYNNTKVKYPSNITIISLFEAQVLKNPEAVAANYEGKSLTYLELNNRANQLAHFLISNGVKMETLIPICLERGFNMLVAILGVLKSGGAYVPIDPDYPLDRISYMLGDTGATLVLSQNKFKQKFSDKNQRFIYLDTDWKAIAQYSITNPSVKIKSKDLAYVIYTSGSTGKPKGAMNEHGGLINRLFWAQDYFKLNTDDVVLQKTTFAFDVSVWELLWPLMVGSKLVFAKPGGQKDTNYLKSLIIKQEISVLHFVPSMLDVFLEDLNPGDYLSLRKVLCSGEALKLEQAEKFLAKMPTVKLYNLYGPTEAAIDVTCWDIPDTELDKISIGKPIANTSIYLLDSKGQLTPEGCIGEICIAGIQVGRGYLNQPELTSQKFIPDTFSGAKDSKIYKSGDLGRWMTDGNIEFLGRMDDQVKIRGFRIELGEIESYLASAADISGSKVLVEKNELSKDFQLRAYLKVDQEKLPLVSRFYGLLQTHKISRTDLHVLPNGLPIIGRNLNEVRFLFTEIFTEQSYLKHGISLDENSVVFDIGANVGFFSVFINVLNKNIKVYSVEPIPEVYEQLLANRMLYGIKGKALALAIMDSEQELNFTYFPEMSLVSGINESTDKVRETVRSYIENSQSEVLNHQEFEALLDMKLESRQIQVKAQTISQVIAHEKIQKIDLLKIDVENSEHFVLKGILEQDWNKIESIIIEVHDLDGRLKAIESLLVSKGFELSVEKEKAFSNDGVLYNVYAKRPAFIKSINNLQSRDIIRSKEWKDPNELLQSVRRLTQEKLPEYMQPASMVLLDRFPLTPNGKIDQKALIEFADTFQATTPFVEPSSFIESELATIWQAILGLPRIGIYDNFFALGGHSLMVMRILSEVRRSLGVELAVKDLFLHPTIASLSGYIKQKGSGELLSSVTALARPDHIALSYGQERLWFIDRLEGSVQYHIPAVLDLRGALDVKSLSASFDAILSRHQVLRTVIRRHNHQAFQYVKPKADGSLILTRWDLKESDLDPYLSQQITRPFDLEQDDMIRGELVQLKRDHYVLIITMHHIASDGWSVSILVNELVSLYESFSSGRQANLPPLAIQYADYALWQRNYLQGEVLERKLNYWRDKLLGLNRQELPIDYNRPAVQSIRGATLNFAVPEKLTQELGRLAQRQNATLFMTLLSGLKVLLYRYSGQKDICVGTPIAARRQREVEDLIGFFVNTLALRSTIDPGQSFESFLEEVKATTLQAYEHQDVPFEKVVEAVVKQRDLSRSPLFGVMFVFQNSPDIAELKLSGLSIKPRAAGQTTAKFDITLSLTQTQTGLLGSLNYCTDLYAESTMQRMVSHYVELLKAIAKAPAQKLFELDYVPFREHQQLEGFNKAIAAYPRDKTVVGYFEQQAALRPGAIAVTYAQQQMSYRELNEQSNQLAHYLVEQGLSPQSLIPICIERGLQMIVGILGILKSSNVYVPIDPEYPLARIDYMLKDTLAKVVLSSTQSKPKLEGFPGEIIELDGPGDILSRQPKTNLSTGPSCADLAYIIYTSGSTGKPKGVMVEHGNVVRLFKTQTPLFDFGSRDVWTLFHSFCFDFSVWEMYGALIYGGRLVIVPSEVTKDSSMFLRLLETEQVTVLNQTPSAFYVLQEKAIEQQAKLKVRYLIYGGEALNPSRVKPWKNQYPESRLINMYGITETTVHVTYKEIELRDTEYSQSVIGKPIPTLRVLILDENQKQQAIGIPGEMYVGGEGLARGYLNNERLTQEKFINYGINQSQRERLYRTGDLGRWLEDGNLEYLGRIDDQVKIRGYRIELGEIETALSQYEGILQSVVIAGQDGDEQRRLIAYVVVNKTYDRQKAMEWLRTKLPEYMVPGIWVEMEALPLTSNGKIDRKALPEVNLSEQLAGQYVAPKTPTEQTLCKLWSDLLGVEKVGIHDNFFELGGDSILAIQLVSRLSRAGMFFQPRDIFTCQTVSRLNDLFTKPGVSGYLAEQGMLSGEAGLLPIQKWFLEGVNNKVVSHFNQSLLISINKQIGVSELENCIKVLVARHDALRFYYTKTEETWIQTYGQKEPKLVTVDLSKETHETYKQLIEEYAEKFQGSLNIQEGDLAQFVWVKTPETELNNRFLMVVHHLAIDGVSWRILLEELMILLNSGNSSVDELLGSKTSSYRQWYKALHNYGSSNRLENQLEFWQKIAQNYQPLPFDFLNTEPLKFKDLKHYQIGLSGKMTQALLKDSGKAYNSEVTDLLLTSLVSVIKDWSRFQRIVIGLEGHGREDISPEIDLTKTMGWFTSLFPVMLELDNLTDPGDEIISVKEQLRKLPDKGLGYGVLKYLSKEPSLQGKEPWDLIFNYFGVLDNLIPETGLFREAPESNGNSLSSEAFVREKIAVNSRIINGQLTLDWTYSSLHFKDETIEKLANAYLGKLELLIEHCITSKLTIKTPSDFGLAEVVKFDELNKFLSETYQGNIRREIIESIYPLSGLQNGMLFHNLYDDQSGAYQLQMSFDMLNMEKDIFIKSWESLLHNHSILRSAFYYNEFSIPVQCVYKVVNIQTEELDFRFMDEVARIQAVTQYQKEQLAKGFKFNEPPLLRLSFLKLPNNKTRVVWTYHHLISDGWSLSIMIRELINTYENLLGGLSVPAITEDRFEDFIRYINKQDRKQAENYWKSYLNQINHPTFLPFIENNPDRNKGVGNYYTHFTELNVDSTKSVNKFCQNYEITVNTLIQTVWAYLLHQYTGQEEVAFGVVVSGRPEDLGNVENRVGNYINTLPFYSKKSEGQKISDWLKQIQHEQIASRAFQYLSLKEIQSQTEVSGDMFDSILVFENYPTTTILDNPKWSAQFSNIQVHEQTNFPLTISVMPNEKLSLKLRYNSRLLDKYYVEEIAEHIKHVVLEFLKADIIDEINILTNTEENLIIEKFNAKQPVSEKWSVLDLFENQANRTPDAEAILFENDSITYAELNSKANQIAHYLLENGIRPETAVPIMMERSPEMISGILGILKAGAAYVPIDPEYPASRISYILEDTGAKVVLTNSSCSPKLSSMNPEILAMDLDWQTIARQPETNISRRNSSTALAYIIYTSGSTGQPKGVMIGHRQLVASITTRIDYYGSTGAMFLVPSFSFDSSVAVIFSTLSHGGCLLLSGSIRDSDMVNQLLGKSDSILCVPSYYRFLLQEGILKNSSLSRVILAGEKLDDDLARKHFEINPSCELFNEYGPTENTVWATVEHVLPNRKVTIGKPITNSQLYILNQSEKLVPVGVQGEICLSGSQLSMGYLNNEALTNEKFIKNPFDKSSRLYKTGDIGRWLPDGSIEYLGRIDDQVKILGYRIELGEIEAALQEIESIIESVVVAKEDEHGTMRLVGYIKSKSEFHKEKVIAELKSRLPEYMIPQLWVPMETIPLTANGKVDKKQLPDPVFQNQALGFVEPADDTETRLAIIWQDVLEVERVGIHDDFFELGGHSLLAIRLISAIRKVFGVEITIADVFDFPSIAKLKNRLLVQSDNSLLPEIKRIYPRPQNIPLSFSQERLWFIDKLEGSIPYHIPVVLALKGKLNMAVLEKSISNIIHRHEILRTVIKEKDGMVFQHINRVEDWRIHTIDKRGVSFDIQKLIQNLIQKPFDLSKDYMLRCDLLQLLDESFILVATFHHIASDGWSSSVMVKELLQSYQNREEGKGAHLPELSVQYADYSLWQRTYLKGETLSRKLDYWKSKLTGVVPLNLPTDYPRKAVQSTRGSSSHLLLDKKLAEQLQALSLQQGTTLFMTLLAAFKVLLYRYSNQQDICVGTPTAGRNRKEIENLIGYFINTLALRTTVNPELAFTDLMQAVKTTTLEAYEHQDTPFEKVVEAVVTRRDLSRSALFQVMFVFQNTPEVPVLRLGDVELSSMEFAHTTSQFDLSFRISETSDGLELVSEYCTDLYHEQSIKRMQHHFKALLESVAFNPGQKVRDLDLLEDKETRQLLFEFNNNRVVYPGDETLVSLFEKQVSQTPHAVALQFETIELTYHQLNERANQIARYLINRGVKQQTPVPLCLERSIEMITGILGILKSGGYYVPIDPEYPQERIRYMLEDTGATLVLTDSLNQAKFNGREFQKLVLDSEWEKLNEEPVTNLNHPFNPQSLAYVIYTSGSTGKPKGVMVEQGSVVNLIKSQTAGFKISAKERILQFSNFSFDASVEQIFLALLNGATLVMLPKRLQLETEGFSRFVEQNRITHLHATPGFLETLSSINFKHLKRVIAGGDLCKRELANQYTGRVKFYNEYGPTETTVTAIEYQANKADSEMSTPLPIGKSVANTSVYILNAYQSLQPIGVPGEIYIGGIQVARGYLNNEELTKEKFIENPFNPNERLYKTGDLGRWLADGNIEFLGRQDDQVKIRGYRIELGEIESAIQQIQTIGQSSVLAREDDQGTRRLVAYVVAKEGFDKDQVIQKLKETLPEYMVPQLWVELDSMPLTQNGKVDKKALPEPGELNLILADYGAPGNETEQILVKIWEEILGVKTVGIHDNFFELGGDSILTIQIVNRAQNEGYRIQPKDVFLYQTVYQLGEAISKRTESEGQGEQGLLKGRAGLIPIQQAFLTENNVDVSYYNQAIVLGIDKLINHQQLEYCAKELSLRHDALRLRFFQEDGNWIQEYSEHQLRITAVNLSNLKPSQFQEAMKETIDEYQKSLNIQKGQLAKMVWLQTSGEESHNRLVLIVHHLAVDGVSWRILLNDLETLLSDLSQNLTPRSILKTGSTRQWYQILCEYGNLASTKEQLGYWNRAIQAYEPLQTDTGYLEEVKVKDISTHSVSLSVSNTGRLIHDISTVYHTEITDMLLCALVITISQWQGNQQVVLGLEGHGREPLLPHIDLSRTVGWFTSEYPVLLEKEPDSDLASQIKSIKEQLRKVPDKGIGFGVLKYLNMEAGLQGKAPWDIVFNYLGQMDQVLSGSRWLKPVEEGAGQTRSLRHIETNKITITGRILEGRLELTWSYSNKQFKESTIQRVSNNYLSNLEQLIAHCSEQHHTFLTPFDCGLTHVLSYKELDKFLETPERQNLERIYRMSGLQEGLLFHSIYSENSNAYLEQYSFDLKNVTEEFILKAWNYILKNHSVLRSAFYHKGLVIPVQGVFNNVELPVEWVDLSEMSHEAQQSSLINFEQSDRLKPFDMELPPLMRLGMLKLGKRSCRMVWTFHHILLDGWSVPVLMEEFLTTYEQLSDGKILLEKTEDSYQDYIRFLDRLNVHEANAFWAGYVHKLTGKTNLPFISALVDRNKGIGNYESKSIYVNRKETDRIKKFSRDNHITLNTVLQGVWSFLLHSYTGNSIVSFGTVVSGRPDEISGVEHKVGLYINTLPLVSKIDDFTDVLSWLGAIQDEQLLSRSYQYTSLAEIKSITGFTEDLFDTLLVFENYPVSEVLNSKTWQLEVHKAASFEHTNYPLTILAHSEKELKIEFNYNTSLLNSEVVEKISHHFENILLQLTDSSNTNLNQLEIFTPFERNQLLIDFNKNGRDFPLDKTILDLFYEQIRKTPDQIAVKFREQSLTFKQLNEKSNQLAHYLLAKGIKQESAVPVIMERSLEMMVAILGILKSGAAYLPIDPEYPQARIDYMLDDSGASVLLTNLVMDEKVKTYKMVEIINPNKDSDLISNMPETATKIILKPEHAAYLIYTSGSTGKPKGVLNEHGGLMNRLCWAQDYFKLNDSDKILQKTSYSFDVSVWELFWPLISGAQLVLAEPGAQGDSRYLKQVIEKEEITILHFVPSMLEVFLNNLPSASCQSLKHVLCSGEALKTAQAFTFREKMPHVKLHNLYGPTEAAIDVTCWSANFDQKLNSIPIGKPIANTRIYILNPMGKPVPVGVPGELFIGGIQVARGYWNKPDLTKEKFVKDTFMNNSTSNLYKTGDLARWLPDGNIEYLGRIDNQVKIRGFRIELGEIENALEQDQTVRQSAVIARENAQGENHLIAYVVITDLFRKEETMSELRQKLPEYMVPAIWVIMDNMPLTINGKIDRMALPEPDIKGQIAMQFKAPQNATEEKLVEMWQELLGLQQIGTQDDFFELGGHSLLVMRMIAHVENQFQVSLPLEIIFQLRNIEQLSQYIEVIVNNLNDVEEDDPKGSVVKI